MSSYIGLEAILVGLIFHSVLIAIGRNVTIAASYLYGFLIALLIFLGFSGSFVVCNILYTLIAIILFETEITETAE